MRAKGHFRNTQSDVSTGDCIGGIFLLAKSILQLLPFLKLKKGKERIQAFKTTSDFVFKAFRLPYFTPFSVTT